MQESAVKKSAEHFSVRATFAVITVGAILVGMQGIGVADEPPKLDVGPSCDAAVRGSVEAGRDKQACLGDEQTAKDALVKDWSKFDQSAKTLCVGMNRTGGPPSYVELLSCLEIWRAAKASERSDPLAGTGPATTPSTTGSAPRASRRD